MLVSKLHVRRHQVWFEGIVSSPDDSWAFMCNVDMQVQVTRLVEDRMVQQPSRAEAYRKYQQTTAMWVPGINAFRKKQTSA